MARVLDEREAAPWAELRELAALRQCQPRQGRSRKEGAEEVLASMEKMGFEIIPDLHLGAGYFRTMVVRQGADYVRYRERIHEEKADMWSPPVTRILKRELDASSDSFASATAQAVQAMMASGPDLGSFGRGFGR